MNYPRTKDPWVSGLIDLPNGNANMETIKKYIEEQG